jgi:hypothetical protein
MMNNPEEFGGVYEDNKDLPGGENNQENITAGENQVVSKIPKIEKSKNDPEDIESERIIDQGLTPIIPEGLYKRLSWNIELMGNASEKMILLTSIHEYMHSDLDNSTTNGLALIGYAYVIEQGNYSEQTLKSYLFLASACQEIHEVYAHSNYLRIFTNRRKVKFAGMFNSITTFI